MRFSTKTDKHIVIYFLLMITIVISATSCKHNIHNHHLKYYACFFTGKNNSVDFFLVVDRIYTNKNEFTEYTLLYHNQHNYTITYDKSSYMLLRDTLFKRYLDTSNQEIYLPYFIVRKNSSSDFSKIKNISNKSVAFYLRDRDEVRRYIENEDPSILKFESTANEVDRASYVSYYDRSFNLYARKLIKGYTKVDSIVLLKNKPGAIDEKVMDKFIDSISLTHRNYSATDIEK